MADRRVMKLLILTPGLYPDTHSGIGKHVFYLSKTLRKLGCRIVIITRRFHPDHLSYEEIADGISCYRVPHPDRFGWLHPFDPLLTAIQSRRWQRKVKEKCPDVDAVLTLNPWWVLFSDPRKLWPCAKLIYLFHYDPYTEIVSNRGNNWKTRAIGRLFNWLTAHCMKKSDRIQVLSDHTKEIALSMVGCDMEKKIIKVPGAVDMGLYRSVSSAEKRALKKRLNVPVDRSLFITVRGLKPRTGVDKLIFAADLLKQKGHSFFLLVIGKGPQKTDIEKQINNFSLGGQVKIVSDLSEEDLVSYYQAADLFILPSQAAEGFGTSTIEALASGLVTLGTESGATPEILNLYRRDWIINGLSGDAIFEKIFQYCSQPEKFSMPHNAIKEITESHFSWPVVARKFLEAIE